MVKKSFMSIMIAVSLMIVGIGTLIACNNNSDVFRVDVFIHDMSNEYSKNVVEQLKEQTKDNKNIEVSYHDGEYFSSGLSSEKQLEQISNALARGTDLMIVAVANYTDAPKIAKDANAQDVQVIFTIREPFNDREESYDAILGDNNPNTAFVGLAEIDTTYNLGTGSLQGELIYKYLTEGKYMVENGTTVNYMQFRGEIGSNTAELRSTNSIKRATELLAKHNITLNPIVEDQDVAWDGARAQEVMDTLLTTEQVIVEKATSGDNKKLNLIVANSDSMTIGVINALSNHGFNTGNQSQIDSILTIGADGLTAAQDYIEQGRMTATLAADVGFNAKIIVEMITTIMAGNKGANMTDGIIAKLNTQDTPLEVHQNGRDVSLFYKPYNGNPSTTYN